MIRVKIVALSLGHRSPAHRVTNECGGFHWMDCDSTHQERSNAKELQHNNSTRISLPISMPIWWNRLHYNTTAVIAVYWNC
jgi:hypothetical protein